MGLGLSATGKKKKNKSPNRDGAEKMLETSGSSRVSDESLTRRKALMIPIKKCFMGRFQYKSAISEKDIEDKQQRIREVGVIEPITVHPTKKGQNLEDSEFELVAGHTRFMASQREGMDFIPAFLEPNVNKAWVIAGETNICRSQDHPIDIGNFFQTLMDIGAYKRRKDIAESYGKDKSLVTKYIEYAQIPEPIKEKIVGNGIRQKKFLEHVSDAFKKFRKGESEFKDIKELIFEIDSDIDCFLGGSKDFKAIGPASEDERPVKNRRILFTEWDDLRFSETAMRNLSDSQLEDFLPAAKRAIEIAEEELNKRKS